jgi:uncharacterized membrane protein
MGTKEMTDATAPAFITTPDRSPAAIRIGDVFGQSRKMFTARWAIYSGIVMIAYAPMLAVNARNGWTTPVGRASIGFDFKATLLGSLLAIAILMLAHAAIYFSVSQEISGRPFSVGQSIKAAFRQSPALIAVVLLTWLYAIFAALLLVVPAIIVFCVYAVASPACVAERIGPIKAMSRSAFLTKGNRWRVFGLMILLFLVTGLLSRFVILLARLAGGPAFSLVVSAPVQGIVGGFSAVAIAVLYAQLRTAREGVDIAHIAAVFD